MLEWALTTYLSQHDLVQDICLREEDCQSNSAVDAILSYITYIGASMSLIGLALTVITMVAFK